jgi:predicted SnoaL-like aldol condensation-catalyzing enzyme
MSSSEKNNQIAVEFFDSAWNKGDFTVLDRLLAPKAIDHSPLGSEEGAEGFKGIISSFRAGMPNLAMTISDEIYSGDRVVHSWVIKGTHTGDRLMGVRIEDDIIQERWTNLDMLGLLTQLGIVPPMG